MAAKVGMSPPDIIIDKMPPFSDDDPLSKEKWFYQPFHEMKNTLNPATSFDAMEKNLFERDEIDVTMEGTTSVTAFGEEIEVLPSPESFISSSPLNDDENSQTELKQKVEPTVSIPGTDKQIYKSKLVNMLNQDPKLSKNRLTRS